MQLHMRCVSFHTNQVGIENLYYLRFSMSDSDSKKDDRTHTNSQHTWDVKHEAFGTRQRTDWEGGIYQPNVRHIVGSRLIILRRLGWKQYVRNKASSLKSRSITSIFSLPKQFIYLHIFHQVKSVKLELSLTFCYCIKVIHKAVKTKTFFLQIINILCCPV